MRTLISICCLSVLLAGCATSTMQSTRTDPNGVSVKYSIKMNSVFQDFKGSDLSASLDPEGKTTVKAGAVDNSTNAMAADAVKSLTDLIKEMLPYIVKAAPVAIAP